ncbi:MAG: hypothetical protein ACJ78Q_12765 [Chloroflexia bacterium]
MYVNYFMVQALMDQAYSEKLQEAANQRRWKRALLALRRGGRASTSVAA